MVQAQKACLKDMGILACRLKAGKIAMPGP